MRVTQNEESRTLDEKVLACAERIEERPDGRYAVLSADALTSEEFADLIMREVHKLQDARKS